MWSSSVQTASWRKHSLFTGLSMVLVLVRSFTRRTVSSESGMVWVILPIIHVFRGDELSTNNATSPGVKFLFSFPHFWCSWRRGKYSRVHLLQNRSARYCTCRHRLLAYRSSLVKVPSGMLGCVFISSKWLGVKGSMWSACCLLCFEPHTSEFVDCRQWGAVLWQEC